MLAAPPKLTDHLSYCCLCCLSRSDVIEEALNMALKATEVRVGQLILAANSFSPPTGPLPCALCCLPLTRALRVL